MKIRLVMCDETVHDSRTVADRESAINFDNGYKSATQVIDAVASYLSSSKRCGDAKVTFYDPRGTITNFVGEMIDQGVIKKEDVVVQMHTFNSIESFYFNDSGVLIDWTFGFFEADTNRAAAKLADAYGVSLKY